MVLFIPLNKSLVLEDCFDYMLNQPAISDATFCPVSGLCPPVRCPRMDRSASGCLSPLLDWLKRLKRLERGSFEPQRDTGSNSCRPPCCVPNIRRVFGLASRRQQVTDVLMHLHPGALSMLADVERSKTTRELQLKHSSPR